MNAIPTRYSGVQFRSRLEARWAAMFDLLEWPWEYEPIDLEGYIPDFIVGFDRPLLIEVKPLIGSPFDWCSDPEVTVALDKIHAGGWRLHGLLVGAQLYNGNHAMGYVEHDSPINPGLFLECHDDTVYAEPFGFKACCGGPVDVVGLFNCCRCGDHDKGPRLLESARVVSLWREAGNRVQWRAPQGNQ